MPELSVLKAIVRPVDVEFYGETVKIFYRPAEMTVEVEDLIFADPQPGEDTKARILGGFVRVIADWDMTEKGKKIPVSLETLRDFPREILFNALRKIGEDQSPSPNGSGA